MPLLLADLDNTLIDRAAASARWARDFTLARHHRADISRREVSGENEEAVVGSGADRPRLETAGVIGLDDRLDGDHLAIVVDGGPALPASGYPALWGR